MSGPPRPETLPANLAGALCLALTAVVFTAEVTLVRLATPGPSEAQIVLFRSLGQLALTLLLLRGLRPGMLRTDRLWLHLLRGLTSLTMWGLYYLSFRMLDLPLATTLTFATSLFVVALAGPVLGERVGRLRWAATGIGFAGVALATGVGLAPLQWGMAVGLLSAAGGATIVLLNRILSRTEPTTTIMAYIGFVTTAAAIPLAALDWHPLSGTEIGLLACAGLLGACGMWLTIEAYRLGEASALAPVPYLRLLVAVAVGWAVFGEGVALHTVAGAALIVAATVLLARHEAAAARRARRARHDEPAGTAPPR